MDTKKCKKCNVERPLDRFDRIYRNNKTYYVGTCRECNNSKKRKGNKKILFTDGIDKQCGVCETIKPIDQFAQKGKKPSYRCKECHNKWYKQYYKENSDTVKQNSKKYKLKNKISIRSKIHGITQEKYNELFNKYCGLCWICKINDGEQIDHDHLCCPGKSGCEKCVRGILCGPCNRMLGHAHDNVRNLRAGIGYLQREWN